MLYSSEVKEMCRVAQGTNHGPAPIPQEGTWTQAREVSDINGLTHGVGWCAPQQGADPPTACRGTRKKENPSQISPRNARCSV